MKRQLVILTDSEEGYFHYMGKHWVSQEAEVIRETGGQESLLWFPQEGTGRWREQAYLCHTLHTSLDSVWEETTQRCEHPGGKDHQGPSWRLVTTCFRSCLTSRSRFLHLKKRVIILH